MRRLEVGRGGSVRRKKLEKRIEDLEQRMARLETLDDEKARDLKQLRSRTAVSIRHLTRLGPRRFDQEGR